LPKKRQEKVYNPGLLQVGVLTMSMGGVFELQIIKFMLKKTSIWVVKINIGDGHHSKEDCPDTKCAVDMIKHLNE
jgi:hypothetical protein